MRYRVDQVECCVNDKVSDTGGRVTKADSVMTWIAKSEGKVDNNDVDRNRRLVVEAEEDEC